MKTWTCFWICLYVIVVFSVKTSTFIYNINSIRHRFRASLFFLFIFFFTIVLINRKYFRAWIDVKNQYTESVERVHACMSMVLLQIDHEHHHHQGNARIIFLTHSENNDVYVQNILYFFGWQKYEKSLGSNRRCWPKDC